MPARKPGHRFGRSSTRPQTQALVSRSAVSRSALMRQVQAKLPLLKRPAVWASGLLLLLPLIFLANYLSDPRKFVNPDGSTLPATPTAAETALQSDSSPQIEASSPDAQPAATENQPSIFQTDLLTALLANSAPSSSSPSLSPAKPSPDAVSVTPSAGSAQKVASTSLLERAAGTVNPAVNLTEQAATSSSAVSSLQTALDRRAGVVAPSSNPLTAQLESRANGAANVANSVRTDSQPSVQAGLDTRARTNADVLQLYGQQLGAFGQVGGQVSGQMGGQMGGQSYFPATSPPLGSTGYVMPPVFRTSYPNSGLPQNLAPDLGLNRFPGSLPSQLPTQPLSNSYVSPTGYGAYPQPSFASPQPQIQTSPFSVPRTPPGRFIGNGQINTFSNP